jgi:predicted acetyltransferase
MKMIFPNINYKEKAMQFVQEFYDCDPAVEIHGSGGLDQFLRESSYEEWLGKILADIDMANIEASQVPALTYFYIREEDDKIIGMINIQLALNDFLKKRAGISVIASDRRSEGNIMRRNAQ